MLALWAQLVAAGTALVAHAIHVKTGESENRTKPRDVRLPKRPDGLLDLLGALQNDPPGTYASLMNPVVSASRLSYVLDQGQSLGGDEVHAAAASDYLGRGWRRAEYLEVKQDVGIHTVVWVKESEQRAIVAFRGSCHEMEKAQCRADSCYLARNDNFGFMTEEVIAHHKSPCAEFQFADVDYLTQARNMVESIRSKHPGYSMLLTGHSMGGNLAIVTAAQYPHTIQAIGISPTPFHRIMMSELKFSYADIRKLHTENLISFGDPYDLGINTILVSDAREGSTTCILHPPVEPEPCIELSRFMREGNSLTDPTNWQTTHKCKKAVHSVQMYEATITMAGADGLTPVSLPICSTSLSTLGGWNIHIDFDSAGKNLAVATSSYFPRSYWGMVRQSIYGGGS